MTIEQEDVIDFVTHNKDEGYMCLIIVDHLDWDEQNQKLQILQNKINAYLSFIESGQLTEQYPEAKGLNVQILLNYMHEPNSDGWKFIELVRSFIQEAGFGFDCEYLDIKES